jgi:type II secretory ATPase GspE/PulE/Tfp pilus assembly ATPase PilB-like protein
MIPPKKKKVGEMGKHSNEDKFAASMQKQLMDTKRSAAYTPASKKEMDDAEKGKSVENRMDKTRKQVQEQEAMKEKIRQNSKDKSNIMNMVRKIITK